MKNERLFAVLVAEKAKIDGHGEDAYTFAFENDSDGYIAVYDGCGGMGAKKYSAVGEKTGAFIASRIAAFLTDQFHQTTGFEFQSDDSQKLHDKFSESFLKVKDFITEKNGIVMKGNMFKTLPTTASIVVMHVSEQNQLICEYLWAGDSRGYFLDNQGMCQITTDDVYTEEDAFTSLRNDAKLKNVIHADGNFELHSKIVSLSLPSVIITATDGVFGYSLTPMHFEYLVLKALYESNSTDEWESQIYNAVSSITGDDFSFIAAVFGFTDFENIKSYFNSRFQKLFSEFIVPSDGAEDEQLYELWIQYKQNYYRR